MERNNIAERNGISRLSEDDIHLFDEGTHYDLQSKFGAHLHTASDGVEGTCFAVWAPNAGAVSVVGDFNTWDKQKHPLKPRGYSGIWEGFVPGLTQGMLYKYHIVSAGGSFRVDKCDPFGVFHEVPPKTASVVWD